MTLALSRRTLLMAGTAALIARPAISEEATTHVVEMLNKDPEDPKQRMVFKPAFLVVKPGDTVQFVSADKGHNSEIIDDMIPEGAEGWKGRINDDIEVTLETPGFYGYKCTPHVGTGMVGLIVVEGDGMMDNLEAAQDVRHRGQAKKRFEALWEQAEEAGMMTA
ncbi:MAG: pseudoazurin [Pseudomonadota bacterium]